MKYSIFTVLFVHAVIFASAQVQIGSSTLEPTARLQVDAASGNAKGFLPPRVSLTATNNNSPFTVTPATGILVYNTNNVSGTNGVSPGYYFYDGARWQRLINQQPDATVEFTSTDNNPGTAGTTFHDGAGAQTNVIYVSRTNGSQWTYNGTIYVTYTAPASTAWYTAGGTTDAGSNKTGSIYRAGKVGIGGSNTPNATLDVRTSPTSTSDPGAGFIGVGTTAETGIVAGAGAIRYSPASGGILQYSNGTSNWNTLSSTVQKTVVTGYFSGTYPVGVSTLSCTETSDVTNAFSANTFTAPRTGLYLITANLLTTAKNWDLREEINIIFSVGGVAQIISPFFSQATITSSFGGPTITAVVSLASGQTAAFLTFAGVRGYTLYSESYNRFSITEL